MLPARRLKLCSSAFPQVSATSALRESMRLTALRSREQRIRSVEPKLTIGHFTRDVSAGQGTSLVGRVGLEPTADGL